MTPSKKEISDRRYADVCGLAKECEANDIRQGTLTTYPKGYAAQVHNPYQK